jgi:HPt (histidine-containing phosphotransfer) domain-containing protein
MLDPDALANLRLLEKTEPGLAAEVVETFLGNAPRRLAEMRAALDAGDATALGKAGHALAGSCGTVGATPMGRLAVALEDLARAGTLTGARDLLDAAERALPDVRDALEAAAASIDAAGGEDEVDA